MMKKFICDTNVFLNDLEVLEGYDIVITAMVLRELDKHKSGKDGDLAFRARKAVRYIDSNRDKFTFDIKDYSFTENEVFDPAYMDNKILQAAIDNGYGIITGDILLKMKAKGAGVEVIELNDNAINSNGHEYKGYKEIEVYSEQEIAEIYEDTTNMFNLLVNEYLIIKYEDEYYCHRWDGECLQDIQLPPKRVVEPQNQHQACALDLLWNKDIPIKFIIGTYGSGKTFLSVKTALEFVNGHNSRKHYGKLMMVRNPIGSGEEIGFLKGTKEDKTQDFYKPLIQHLNGGEFEMVQMETMGKLQKEIPYYMKGLDIVDTFIIADEAEDLTVKLIKLIGTRIGQGSAVVFSGDYKQAEDKYKSNNGLKYAIEQLKGNPLVGVVYLPTDIRSEASKIFADL